MLCRAILEQLNRNTVSAVLLDPLATREDLLKTLLMEFGVISVSDLKKRRFQSTSRTELNFLLREFLESLTRSASAAIVVIDEAHNLTPALWEEIRILSDLHSDHRPLHLLLVGQPALSNRLKQPDTTGIDQRISVRCQLEPLSRDEVEGFVNHRLAIAQPRRTCEFSVAALDLVFHRSRGVPRIISLLCDRALHEAATCRSAMIDHEIIDAASTRLVASISSAPAGPARRLSRPARRLAHSPRSGGQSHPKSSIGGRSAKNDSRLVAAGSAAQKAVSLTAGAGSLDQWIQKKPLWEECAPAPPSEAEWKRKIWQSDIPRFCQFTNSLSRCAARAAVSADGCGGDAALFPLPSSLTNKKA